MNVHKSHSSEVMIDGKVGHNSSTMKWEPDRDIIKKNKKKIWVITAKGGSKDSCFHILPINLFNEE